MWRTIVTIAVVASMVGVVGAGVSIFFPSVVPGIAGLATSSDVRAQIHRQGVVAVSGVRFTGTGQFKFAIRDPDTSTNVWTNSADTSPADGVPDLAVSLTVTNGIYNVQLGDTGITNMDAISSSLFADGNLLLRVWFNDGTNGWQLLSPDQNLTSSPYTFVVADSSVATSKLVDDAVTSAKILDSAVTSAKITDGTIANTDVNSSAAIAWSKLSKSGAGPSDVGAQAPDADLDDLADGSLSGSKVGTGISASNVTTGSLSGSLVGTGVSASNVTTGSLSGSLVGSGVSASNVTTGTLGGSLVGTGLDAGNITTGTLSGARFADGAVTVAKLASGIATPAGALTPYAGSSAPTGWLFCDGSAVSRTTYADLFTAIGTTYGAGDGSTTFNVPDFRGRIPIGVGTGTGGAASGTGKPTGGSALTARSRADWAGAETHTLTTTEMPSHSHGTSSGDGFATGSSIKYALASAAGCNNTTCGTGSAGGNGAHNNIQPFLVANFIIKY